MCFVWLLEQIVTLALYIINRLVFITEAESVYCAVRIESLYNTDTSHPYRAKDPVYTMQSAHSLSTNPSQLLLCREIITVFSETHTNHINTNCEGRT